MTNEEIKKNAGKMVNYNGQKYQLVGWVVWFTKPSVQQLILKDFRADDSYIYCDPADVKEVVKK